VLEADVELDRRDFRLSAAFAVAAGERLALFGPSGAGKTTILEVIAGLQAPGRGTVVLGGRVLTRTAAPRRQVPPWQRRVGLLRQDPALFPHLSVRQNLAYAAKTRPGPGTGRDEITRIAERLGIGGLVDDRPARLSGGQAHRVALGRLLARRAGVAGAGAGGTVVPVRLREAPAGGGDFTFTVLAPPCFRPDGTRVTRAEEVPT
jgi:molybdate transport system ATP-binding protein